MNTIRIIFHALIIVTIFSGFICEDTDSPVTPQGGGAGAGLSATSTNLTVLKGGTSTVIISSGSAPYSLVQNSNPTVAMVSLSQSQLTVEGIGAGSTNIVIEDASSPKKSVTIAVTVVTTITISTPGTVAFTYPNGDFLASGPLSISENSTPTEEGAGALQQFGATSVIAYKVYSPTNIDLFEADFIYATSLVTGTYSYPSGGNKVEIIYYKNFNVQDTVNRPTVYIFSAATAAITSVTATMMTGTFSGTGVNFYNNTQFLTISNGTFNVPIKNLGGMEDRSIDSRIGKILRKHSFQN